MRMSVFFGGPSMSRPTGVTQTKLSGNGLLEKEFFEIPQFTRRAPDLKILILNDRNAGRIITTIFEGLKPSHDYRNRISRANVSENATHKASRIAWFGGD